MHRLSVRATRHISQHLTIHSTNAKSAINFHVNLLKVPSNFGYYTSRVTRLYNEDRWQAAILDLEPASRDGMLTTEDFAHGGVGLSAGIKATASLGDRVVFAFGVFDGHGGDECAQFLKDRLFGNVEGIKVDRDTCNGTVRWYRDKISGYWKRWGRKLGSVMLSECRIERAVYVFASERGVDLDDIESGKNLWWVFDMMAEEGKLSHWELFKIRLWLAYLDTDVEFLSYETLLNTGEANDDEGKRLVNAGSTSTACYLYAVERKDDDRNGYFYQNDVLSRLIVAQVGDTRAIICDKDGVAHSLTKNHHPSNPIEATRLRRYSTGLIMTDSFGEERYLNYANTRSFGDILAKDKGISAEPEFSEYLIGDRERLVKFKARHSDSLRDNKIEDFGGDECFLVLVSDGVTNVITDQEIVDLVMTTFNNRGVNGGNPAKCAEEVVSFVEHVGGEDNATCLVIRLSGWGNWPVIDRTGKLREERMLGTRYNR